MRSLHRTPDKRQERNEGATGSPKDGGKAGPSPIKAVNVRKSIDEWDATRIRVDRRVPVSPGGNTVATVPSTKLRARVVLPQEGRIATATQRRPSTDAAGPSTASITNKEAHEAPPVPKNADRTTTARSLLQRGKYYLGISRNLKGEIKTEVATVIERLYNLVKEAENIKRTGKEKTTELNKTYTEDQQKETEEITNKTLKENIYRMAKLTEKLEEQSRLIEENSKQMETLKTSLEARTYANVVAEPKQKETTKQTALHSVIVTSKIETETGEEVLTRVREAVNAKDGWVQVERVRKAKDRKIIIGCKTDSEKQRVKERLNTAADHLVVEDVKNKDPLVVIRGVLSCNSNDEMLQAIRKQNGPLFSEIGKEEDRMEAKYRKKARNPLTCHLVVRVSPALYNAMLNKGYVHIDLQKLPVADQSPLVQCSLCLGYGHGRRFCTQAIEKCSHCGGPHIYTECDAVKVGASPTCCNCVQQKVQNNGHNAFSANCPVRRRWDALAREAIAYC